MRCTCEEPNDIEFVSRDSGLLGGAWQAASHALERYCTSGARLELVSTHGLLGGTVRLGTARPRGALGVALACTHGLLGFYRTLGRRFILSIADPDRRGGDHVATYKVDIIGPNTIKFAQNKFSNLGELVALLKR